MVRAAQEVGRYLGNTPAVARSSYIDPRVFDRFQTGEAIAEALADLALADGDHATPLTHGGVELAVLELIEDG